MKKIKAFSLLEIAISLAIIGVLTLAVMQGQKLLFEARIETTAKQIEAIRYSFESFRDQYGQLPGDYNQDELNIANKGNGNGIIDANESDFVWEHLYAAGLISKKQSKPTIGGIFFVENENGQNYLILATNKAKNGLLTSQDALILKLKIDGHSNNEEGLIKIKNSSNNNSCLNNDGSVNKANKAKSCIIEITLD